MSSDVRDEEIEILASGYDGGISDTDSEASTVVAARSTTSDQRIQTNNEEAQFGKTLTGCSVCDMGFDGHQVILDSNENHPTVERVEELERQMQNIEKLVPTAEKRGNQSMQIITSMSSFSSSFFLLRFLVVTLAVILLGLSGRLVLDMGVLQISRSVLNLLSRHLPIPSWTLFILRMVGFPFPRLPRGNCTTR
ncbi:uncharacterized protein APUU_20849S [Aspergillus puulaauensis]|uniref:Uncharacterized protein n=1 Tax=Aspergillus puulaauensis TaxID=1220207 RepID=A0A7R7XFL1_9EURO|nr:uncharacterized protein APUU_20849S [Aspergillus puulaauensis]BCS20417.1 hypothetical protein APUU_20849S [Aspergillus puulaauensis]